jgi:hypothetical protein
MKNNLSILCSLIVFELFCQKQFSVFPISDTFTFDASIQRPYWDYFNSFRLAPIIKLISSHAVNAIQHIIKLISHYFESGSMKGTLYFSQF